MSDTPRAIEEADVFCVKCGVPLERGKVSLSYLGYNSDETLLKCPSCGKVYLPESLATGKIAELERTLEDK